MTIHIRTINPIAHSEIDLVAARMRQTLVEVLGEAEGGSMYSIDWLRKRVLFHLDPAQSAAAVFVSEDDCGRITGHAIVRVERDEAENEFGLFSTVYVVPNRRFRRVNRIFYLKI